MGRDEEIDLELSAPTVNKLSSSLFALNNQGIVKESQPTAQM
jgi:hypothetical protein